MQILIECQIFGPTIVSATEKKKTNKSWIISTLLQWHRTRIFARDTAHNNMLAQHTKFIQLINVSGGVLQPHYTEQHHEHIVTYFQSKKNYATFWTLCEHKLLY